MKGLITESLLKADTKLKEAKTIYRDWIIQKAREAKSVRNLAALCKIPVTTIYSALERSNIKTLHDVAHEIDKKLSLHAQIQKKNQSD